VVIISKPNNFKIAEDFNLREFICTHPEHDHVIVYPELVEKLQKLRNLLDNPIYINSAYRCPERNRQVGGAENSQHLHGTAVDFLLRNHFYDIEEIGSMAINIGFTGIGYYNTHIHVDIRELPEGRTNPIIWDNRR